MDGEGEGGAPEVRPPAGEGPTSQQPGAPSVVPPNARPLPGVHFPLPPQGIQPQPQPRPQPHQPTPPGSPASGSPAPGERGRDRSRSRRGMLLLLALAVVALGVGAFVVLGDDEGSSDVEALGAEVGNALAVAGEAEREVRAAAEAGDAAIADDMRCWFSYPAAEASEPNSFVRCGPILLVDSDPDAFWVTVPVRFDAGQDTTIATLDLAITLSTSELDPGERLVHPEGGSPPEPGDVDLEPPPPPPADPARTEVTEGSPPIDLDEQPEDGRLHGKAYRLNVDGFSYTDRVAVPAGDDFGESEEVLSAASGEQWLIAQLTVDSLVDVWDQPAAEFALVVDGRRRDLGSLADEFDSSTRTWTLVASVPTDAEELAIVGSEVELEQTWSFLDQQRSEDAPDVLYRDEQSLSTDVNQQFSLPFGIDDADDFDDSPFGEQQASLSIGTVRLDYMVEDDTGRVHTASGSDRALLSLGDVDGSSGVNAATSFDVEYQVPAESVVLTLADGTQVTARRLSEDGTPILGGLLVWDVPADIETATVTITPGRGPDLGDPSDTIDFQDGAATFDIDFGPA